MSLFKQYVMSFDAVEVKRPFGPIAEAIGGQVLREGNRHVGVILPRDQNAYRQTAHEGDFIVRNPAGTYIPVRPDIFSLMYRAATEKEEQD